MASIKKKLFGVLMTVIMMISALSTTAFAAENPRGGVSQASYATEENITRATVPGAVVTSNTCKFKASGTVSLKVPAGKTAKHAGIIIADRTTGTASTDTFYVSPAFPNVSVFQGSSSVQFFTLAGNGVTGERTISYTFTVKDAPIEHEYEVAVILYE